MELIKPLSSTPQITSYWAEKYPRDHTSHVRLPYIPLPLHALLVFPFIQQHFAKWEPHVGGLLCNSSEGFLPVRADLCSFQTVPREPVADGPAPTCSMFTLDTWQRTFMHCPVTDFRRKSLNTTCQVPATPTQDSSLIAKCAIAAFSLVQILVSLF